MVALNYEVELRRGLRVVNLAVGSSNKKFTSDRILLNLISHYISAVNCESQNLNTDIKAESKKQTPDTEYQV